MKCVMWNAECKMRKAGVSLITVLLFMLVATIAATATYKWITSEGRSSGSRMQQREAYQSAIAGIESARAWMSYNANDVGALIKQYKGNNNNPIRLDAQLAEFARAGQSYHVWLTGVNTESSTYKLKIVSEGLARNGGARHSEVAILNVTGLYQVKIPSVKYSGNVDFHEAFFGSARQGISLDVNSAIFNGDTKFNTMFNASDYVIVTGDVNVNSNTNVGDLYVKGSLYSCTNLNVNGDTYVEETMYINGTHEYKGDIYAKGGIDLSKTGTGKAQCNTGYGGNFTVDGNVSLEGNLKMPRHTAENTNTFNGNLVLKNGAKIDFPTLSEFGQVGSIPWTTSILGNVFLDGGFTNGWHIGYARAPNFVLGSSGKNVYTGSTPIYRVTNENAKIVYNHWVWNYNRIDQNHTNGVRFINKYGNWQTYGDLVKNTYCDDLYCAPTHDFSSSYFFRNDAFYCDWSWVNGQYVPINCGCTWKWTAGRDFADWRWQCVTDAKVKRNEIFMQVNGTYVTSMPDTNGWGANRLQDYEDKITQENTGTGCGTTNHVKDPIQFNTSLLNHNLMHSSSQKKACENLTLWNSWPSPHGWLQLNSCYQKAKDADELYDDTWLLVKVSSPQWATDASDYLQGNFIIVVDGSATNGLYLPQTKVQENGEKSNVILYFPDGYNAIINSSGGSNPMNYFIFSDGDLENMQLSSSKLNGSVFLTDCHNMGSTNTIRIEYNADLTNALTASGVICNNDGSGTCSKNGGASSSASSSESSESISFGGTDSYYVSMAPQLSITLESQYANNENIETIQENANNVDGSFIVLPRVIYLPVNPKGKLEHYYNVIPLNSRNTVESQNVTCEGGIPTAGRLYNDPAKLVEGYYKCQVTGTVGQRQSTVPFYVVVRGTDGTTPKVTFVEDNKELQKGNTTTIQLDVPNTTGAAQTFNVRVARSGDETGWTVTPVNPVDGSTCNANGECIFQITTNSVPRSIFTVTNNSASSGMLTFQILDCEGGCSVGIPNIETVHISSSVNVQRKTLTEWCNANGDGETDEDKAKCAKKALPDCSTDAEWIRANGTSCITGSLNNNWSCDIAGDISLISLESGIPNGCEVVTPGANLLVGPHEDGANKHLYASLKARPQIFHAGFQTSTDIGAGQTIHIEADHVGASSVSKDCSYAHFKNLETRAEYCDIEVYYGSVVTLSFENESDRTDFNYWLCESGIDCPTEKVPVNSYSYVTSVTGENTVYAHYKEKDKHCFFDEFKEQNSRINRTSLTCGSGQYCIDYCSGTCSDAVTGDNTNAKWRLIDGTFSDINFTGDGTISLKSSATRNKKESQKGSATIMSTVQAGIYGTLKAQFQVPREGVNSSDQGIATVKQSGFMLRSNANGNSYLMLNVYSDYSDNLMARICINGGSICKEKRFESTDVYSGSIITIDATIGKSGDDDALEIKAYTNPRSSSYKSVTFLLKNSELDGIESLGNQSNEYTGFKISDPNFKIHGIGWKSDDYVSQCWETFPTVSCSFKAAYAGGIVPANNNVFPWVALSSWFENVGDCTPIYYYKGDDAGCTGAIAETDYKECSSGYYNFTEEGPHGATVDGDKVARASVSGESCNVYGEAAAWANSAVAAHCGAFWVGEFEHCTNNVTFGATVTTSEGKYWGLDAGGTETANLRESELIITLENPNAAEISVYLFSKNATSGYTYGQGSAIYSLPYTTSKAGSAVALTIPIVDISNTEGFDPEHVVGVYIRTDDNDVVIKTVKSRCPYVLSMTNCAASYDGSNKKWNISAKVNNGSSAGDFTVTETYGYITGSITSDCKTEPSGCSWTGDNAIFEWPFNVYEDLENAGVSSRDYKFQITMNDRDGHEAEGSPCQTLDLTMTGIRTTCSVNKTTVVQGQGLPVFSYSISGCPTSSTGCPYEVQLKKDDYVESVLVSNNEGGGDISYTTSADAANKTTVLPVGTYKFNLASTGDETPFSDCEKEFTVIKDGDDITATCSFQNSSIQLGQSTKFTVSSFSVQNKNISVEVIDSDENSISSNGSFWANNNFEIQNVKPTSTGSLTYIAMANGSEACRATLTVSGTTATCHVSLNNYGTSSGTIYTTNTVYFIGKNDINTNDTYSVSLYEGSEKVTDATLSANSNWMAINLGTLSAGSHSYTLKMGSEEICDASVTVVEAGSDVEANCYVSLINNGSSSGTMYDNKTIYFVAQNKENTNDTYDVYLYEGNTKIDSATLAANSNWTSFNLGTLSPGTHSYSLKSGSNTLCNASGTIVQIGSDATATCGVSSHDWEIYNGDGFDGRTLYFMAKNNTNTNDKFKVYLYTNQVLADSFEMNSNSNWSKYTLGTLSSGVYVYSLKVADHELCADTIRVGQIRVTCPSSKTYTIGQTADFKASTLTNCTTCNYVLKTTDGNTTFASLSNGTYNAASTSITMSNVPSSPDTLGYRFVVTDYNDAANKDSCGGTMVFTEGSSFPCNDANSTAIAKEYEREDNANSCTKYTMDGASRIQIGCWWAPETPVSITLQKCDGTTTTVSHTCQSNNGNVDGWLGVDVGGPCTIYLQPEKKIKWKFNNW